MKNTIKLYAQITFSVLIFASCNAQKKTTEKLIVLKNTSNLELPQKAISIKRSELAVKDVTNDFAILLHKKDTIPAQLNDLDNDGKWDELFFVADFSPKETKTITLNWSKTNPKFPIKTSARFGKREGKNLPVHPDTQEVLLANQVHKKLGYQKYQTDGPTWENDKVGFRHYLDGRNSKDVFGKRIPAITPEDVGINSKGAVEDNYHVMYDWGRDIFPVGNSAGLGGFALLIDNKINRLGIIASDTLNNIEKTTFKIVSEGPVNSVLSYNYQNWEASGNKYQAKETTSIWPGMYGYKNTIAVDGLKGKETLLIALSNLNNQNPLQVIDSGDFVCFIQHDKLTYERQWILGTAIIIPKNVYKGYMEAPKTGQLTDSYLIKLNVKNNQEVSYYPIAGWELSADKNFKDSAYFANYVTTLAKQLSVKIKVEVK
ncbi:DUF4861 domain-containing protein [Flavobacterium sp. ANB]|uniref:DUF4861 domain-containing protein n=1 Tax=unclassified Flavobacterium TaxID=196869 RepID=UPI0012B9614F|nr:MULTISPECIES: DUF4861 domain-containing protein [unclassified Flavobacterium]MBF4516734.1 DUF4861 domain-containing protein [Flavobacterium sp. ANB]MTD69370.1 DUF4861 domain-containing protein [Flavobacterium sp. LC2016-13]